MRRSRKPVWAFRSIGGSNPPLSAWITPASADRGSKRFGVARWRTPRKQLNPHEEALAVKAMLDRGLTADGAAQALGSVLRPGQEPEAEP